MTKATTFKAISLATVIAVAASMGSTAFAHDLSEADQNVAAEENTSITRNNAKNLVKTLLKREYGSEGYSARTTRKVGDSWVVTIKDRVRTVATASVDAKTGNIHIQ